MNKTAYTGFQFGPKTPQKPSEKEEEYFARKEMERRKQKHTQPQKHEQLEPAYASIKDKVIIAVLKEALPMLMLDPTKVEMKWILKALRENFGLDSSAKIVWSTYMTFREEASNKYHYFVVFKDGDKFHAANAYGRIGYPARVHDIGTFASQSEAVSKAQAKADGKLAKGYKETEVK